MGDPACDRILFNPPQFEEIHSGPPSRLFLEYLLAVKSTAATLSPNDKLVLVLAGHGRQCDGAFVIGNKDNNIHLEKYQLEQVVNGTRAKVFLINTACFSGQWTSPHWTLLAGAESDDEAVSIAQSNSDEFRGGIFTNALIAQHADEFCIRAPRPAVIDSLGIRGKQHDHDFGPNTGAVTSRRSPSRSLADVLVWMNEFRNHLGRCYTNTEFIISPCSPSAPHQLPLAPLQDSPPSLQFLHCVPPSPRDSESLSAVAHTGSTIHSSTLPDKTITTMTADDETDLMKLTNDFQLFPPPHVSSELSAIRQCSLALKGRLSPVQKVELLQELRERNCQRHRALKIATRLGWTRAIQKLGDPFGKQIQEVSQLRLRQEAECSGCFTSILETGVSYQRWNGAAGWLARIWEDSGRPNVSLDDWHSAVE
jgi:hypothetical protein